jgi:Tol biopolymer transport system component
MTRHVPLATTAVVLVFAAAALGRTFGPEPVAVSASSRGANGPSGSPAISGDNRVVRYVAFHSFASDLTPGDTNGALDVFLYTRATRKLSRVSLTNKGRQANGASANAALDGSVQRAPRCVAFQSQATNLSPADRDRSWDIYVRDLKARKTRLLSRGVAASALDPAISGDCRQVAFTSAGRIYIANGLKGGRPHVVARGTNPDLSLDGSALTWERGHGVWLRRRGRTSRVAGVGGNPHVSDGGASRIWSVVYDGATDVYMKVFKSSGRAVKTKLISGRNGKSLGGTSHNGGITAYAHPRGIVTFTNTQGSETTLWYMNLHTGNIDDLAHAHSHDGSAAIFDVATSARANYAVFSSTDSFRGDVNGPTQDVFLKFLSGK